MASKNGKPDKTLTQRQEEFSMAVVQGASLSEAYRQSHNHPNMKAKTVWEKASRLRAMDKVLARIEELREVGKERVEYDHTQWLQEIQRCAFFDPRKLFDSHGNPIDIAELPDDVAPAIAGFEIEEVFIGKKEEGRIPAGYTRKFKLTDKLRALELFGKATGYYVDHSVPAPSQLEAASTELLVTMCAAIRERMQAKALPHVDGS